MRSVVRLRAGAKPRASAILAGLVTLGLSASVLGEIPDCAGPIFVNGLPTMDYLIETDEYYLEVGSASGAVGDVVPVTVVLHSQLVNIGWISLDIVVCHDPETVELVGGPRYTDEFLGVSLPFLDFHLIEEGSDHPGIPKGHGFHLHASLSRDAYNARFPSELPLTVMTIFYRIKGEPGDSSALRLCDGELILGRDPCRFNKFHMYTAERPQGWDYLSTRNVDGTLTVLDGPPTNTEPPPEPPEAKIYPEPLNDEDVNLRVRITGAAAAPGDQEVPVEVYASADVEYPGILVAVDFDERYLHLGRVEHLFLSGVTLVSNRDELPGGGPDEGHVVITNGFGINRYRLAEEGEEIHVATLYFDVLEAAEDIALTTLDVLPVTDHRGIVYSPFIIVRHREHGIDLKEPEVRSKVSPLLVTDGRFHIVADGSAFIRGDANRDQVLDLSDAQYGLNYMFLGSEPPVCLDAADANDDGKLDIADPVATLQFLFAGGAPLPPPRDTPGPDPTVDELDCLGL